MKTPHQPPMRNGQTHFPPPAVPRRPAPYRGLLLGWNNEPATRLTPEAGGTPALYEGDAPIFTCGMTGSGKGRGALIPTLFTQTNPVFVIDMKAELCHVTARRRREMGHKVVLLDPCQVATVQSDGLNPLDLLTLPGAGGDADAQMLASLLAVGNKGEREPFWYNMATSLIGGIIAHIANAYPPGQRHLGHLRAWLYHRDLDMAIATALDRGEVRSRFAYDQFVSYLAAPNQETRPCIRAVACSYINALCGEQTASALAASTFSLRDVYDGKPLSIYLIIPPDALESLKPLWRLWVGTLLTTVMRRKVIPKLRTLFLLDEIAQLGEISALRQAVTLLRGAGLQVWSFWQDLSQLRRIYPQDWETMLNNAEATQLLSMPNHLMAREWGGLLGLEPTQLARLAPEGAVVSIRGRGARIVRRPDYLKDAPFAGLYDANPRFAQIAESGPATGRLP